MPAEDSREEVVHELQPEDVTHGHTASQARLEPAEMLRRLSDLSPDDLAAVLALARYTQKQAKVALTGEGSLTADVPTVSATGVTGSTKSILPTFTGGEVGGEYGWNGTAAGVTLEVRVSPAAAGFWNDITPRTPEQMDAYLKTVLPYIAMIVAFLLGLAIDAKGVVEDIIKGVSTPTSSSGSPSTDDDAPPSLDQAE